MNRFVPADMVAYVFLIFGQVFADSQLVSEELCGLKCNFVERFKHDQSQLPHCGGAGPVDTTTVPLGRNVRRGTYNT